MKIVAGIFGGLLMAIVGLILISIILSTTESSGGIANISFLVLWVTGIVMAVRSERAGKAWKKLLMTSGILLFLYPIAGIIFSIGYMFMDAPTAEDQAYQVAGGFIGGGVITITLAIIGFFLGAIFMIIGIQVGKDKR
jgi:hypothetical protein